MSAHRAAYPIRTMCRVLGVSPSGYYAWQARTPSPRQQEDARLQQQIVAIHATSDGTYGAPRIHAELQAQGTGVGRKRVARLMRLARIAGVSRRRSVRTTRRSVAAVAVPDLVRRNFRVHEPNQLWVADITYIPLARGFDYLAVVLDAFSRRVVGWQQAGHLRQELVLAALQMALDQRRPQQVIHHSDHGSQYTSYAFGQRCRLANVRPSRGAVGDCYDNALCESFFASLECELLDRYSFATARQARQRIFRYIEGWYNPHRRHSALRYLSPLQFELHHSSERLPLAM